MLENYRLTLNLLQARRQSEHAVRLLEDAVLRALHQMALEEGTYVRTAVIAGRLELQEQQLPAASPGAGKNRPAGGSEAPRGQDDGVDDRRGEHQRRQEASQKADGGHKQKTAPEGGRAESSLILSSVVEARGFEPLTSCLQSRRSPD